MYKEGSSLNDVGIEYGISRQAVYAALKRMGYKLRTREKLKHIEYNGFKFTLRNTGYYAKTVGVRNLLHRYVYEQEVCKVPYDWDVHHIDGNKENNSVENLVSLPKNVHAYLFATGGNQYVKGNRQSEILGVREREINKYITKRNKQMVDKKTI